MDTNLVGYLLDSLDASTHSQVEAYLRSDPRAREQLELLRQALAPLEADRDSPLPPPDLAVKTLARVAEHTCRLPRSPRPLTGGDSILRPFFRRADVLLAACLLLAVVGLVAPAIARLHTQHLKASCQNNLRQFYAALASYHDQHGTLPNFAEQERRAAGIIAPMLKDAGVLPVGASMRCPANGSPVYVNWTNEQIQNMSPERFEGEAPRLLPSYAYSLGYRDDSGSYHFPDRPKDAVASLIPLMADRPPAQAHLCATTALPHSPSSCNPSYLNLGNSPNHGGLGQNVLYHDGHVRFATQRTVGVQGDDIYVNRQMKVEPGIGPLDTVLAPSAARP